MNIAFFASSLLSAYWNGAATYYRGIIKALHANGHRITFYEPVAYDRLCMHEFTLSGAPMKRDLQIRTLDLAKRLLDFGVHPPTVYFPLLVDEALLIEPTETETRETLDAFAEMVAEVLREAAVDPEIARGAPYTAPVRRLDEARAARRPGGPRRAERRGSGTRGSHSPSVTGRISSATRPWASWCTAAAASADGASTRQKICPWASSTQYLR